MTRGFLAPEDVSAIASGFELGQVERVEFVPAGLMNQNWQFGTDRGMFAVKRFMDGSGGDARMNLVVMRVLAAQGRPVCAPLATDTDDLVLDIGTLARLLRGSVGGRSTASGSRVVDRRVPNSRGDPGGPARWARGGGRTASAGTGAPSDSAGGRPGEGR